MKNAIIRILLTGILAIALLKITVPDRVELDFSGVGTMYSVSDPLYSEDIPVSFKGQIINTLVIDKIFKGTITADSLWDFNKAPSVTVSFSNTVGKPIFYSQSGVIYTTPIHSVIIPENRDYAIICLYSKYVASDDFVTASFSYDDSSFICVGNISRYDAIKTLDSLY